MGAKRKPWASLARKQQKIVVEQVCELVQSYCKDAVSGRDFLSQVVETLNDRIQHLQLQFGEQSSNHELLVALGQIRENNLSVQELDKPIVSIAQLDSAVCCLGWSHQKLQDNGYQISRRSFASSSTGTLATTSNPSTWTSKRGRKAILDDTSIVDHVRNVLAPHLVESERVAVVGRGNKKRMIVAQHLRKKKYRLYMEESQLNARMSWSSFHRILKHHFPHIRSPIRKTDLCEHCLHFEKRLLPRAEQTMANARKDLLSIWPDYFTTFDSNKVIQQKMNDKDRVPLIARFVAFLNTQNFNANRNSARTQALGLSARLSLHAAEAKIIHTMKAHVELLEAYRWHQISARRQASALAKLTSEGGLASNAALIQVDFKENVRYPLSTLAGLNQCFCCPFLLLSPLTSCPKPPSTQQGREETGDEWHAQNKLSLTVFGVHALVPNKEGSHSEIYILIVTEILDHDAQMGNMMINRALNVLQKHPALDWPKVTKLWIVSDVGPHFRSYENAAHFLCTLASRLCFIRCILYNFYFNSFINSPTCNLLC